MDFAERLAGRSVASIARALNDNGVPCPSGTDTARNPHRHGDRWMLTTVAAILANPRYTGRQVGSSPKNSPTHRWSVSNSSSRSRPFTPRPFPPRLGYKRG
jgi:hypothetical protein